MGCKGSNRILGCEWIIMMQEDAGRWLDEQDDARVMYHGSRQLAIDGDLI